MPKLADSEKVLCRRGVSLWRGLAVRTRGQGLGVALSLGVALAVANVGVHRGYHYSEFALPAAEQTQNEDLPGATKRGELFAQMALVSTKGSPKILIAL